MNSGFGGSTLFGTVCVESEIPQSKHPLGLQDLKRNTQTDSKMFVVISAHSGHKRWLCIKFSLYQRILVQDASSFT